MNDMKCPFCGEKLVKWIGYADCRFWTCYNVLCEAGRFGHIADECIWQELMRTRKALDVAVDMLKEIDKTRSVANHKIGTQDKTLNSGIVFCWTTPDEIHNTLEQITALEQKDK